jgi:hypothetical protein
MRPYSNAHYCISLLLLSICYCACQQPAPKVKQPVEKMVFLQFVKKLVLIENRTPGGGIYLLRSFARDHNLEIIDSTRRFVHSSVLQVRFSQMKDFTYYEFFLPKNLQDQLTYRDFDQAYGAGIETPHRKNR